MKSEDRKIGRLDDWMIEGRGTRFEVRGTRVMDYRPAIFSQPPLLRVTCHALLKDASTHISPNNLRIEIPLIKLTSFMK
jgi:hypothetical protein